VGRAAADDRSWGVGLNDPAGDRALAVCLGRDGTLEVGDIPFGRRSPAMAGIKKLQHPAIRPGNERNTLMLILRGGRSLEIYANGTSVSRPIQLIRLLLGQELGAQWHVAKSIWRGAAIEGDVACQAVGKVLSDRDVGWKVGFATTKRDKDDVAVLVRRDGGVEICNLFTYPPTTILGPIRHPAIKPGNEDNKVLAVLRGGQTLEVYVNDQAICAPITLREPLPSVVPGIGLWERCGAPELKGRAEFSSLKLWKLPGS
jgi:hypothetical protein